MMQRFRLSVRPWIAAALAIASATVTNAQSLGPIQGMTAASYSMSGSVTGRTTTSLGFASTSNPAYNPSFVAGISTGDVVTGDGSANLGWFLQAVAADYGALFSPGSSAVNVIGSVMQTDSSTGPTPDFVAGDSLASTYTLVFTADQTFIGLNGFGSIDLSSFSTATATLARSGGATTDLTVTALGTQFTAGSYTLTLSGSLAASTGNANLFAVFATPVPAGGGAVALFAATLATRRRRR